MQNSFVLPVKQHRTIMDRILFRNFIWSSNCFQFMKPKFSSLEHLFSVFDLSICCAAYHNKTLYINDNAAECIMNSEINLNRERDVFDLDFFMTVNRAYKYKSRFPKFQISDKLFDKIVDAYIEISTNPIYIDIFNRLSMEIDGLDASKIKVQKQYLLEEDHGYFSLEKNGPLIISDEMFELIKESCVHKMLMNFPHVLHDRRFAEDKMSLLLCNQFPYIYELVKRKFIDLYEPKQPVPYPYINIF